jgi:hypothetical protein
MRLRRSRKEKIRVTPRLELILTVVIPAFIFGGMFGFGLAMAVCGQ